jgi:hypothetical protein
MMWMLEAAIYPHLLDCAWMLSARALFGVVDDQDEDDREMQVSEQWKSASLASDYLRSLDVAKWRWSLGV